MEGAPGQPRPVLYAAGVGHAVELGVGANLARFDIDYSASSGEALVTVGYNSVERVLADSSGGTACLAGIEVTVADSICTGASGLYESIGGGGSFSLTLRNDTIYAQTTGIVLYSNGPQLDVTADNTIVHGGSEDILAIDQGAGHVSVSLSHSNYASVTAEGGASVTAAGSGTRLRSSRTLPPAISMSSPARRRSTRGRTKPRTGPSTSTATSGSCRRNSAALRPNRRSPTSGPSSSSRPPLPARPRLTWGPERRNRAKAGLRCPLRPRSPKRSSKATPLPQVQGLRAGPVALRMQARRAQVRPLPLPEDIPQPERRQAPFPRARRRQRRHRPESGVEVLQDPALKRQLSVCAWSSAAARPYSASVDSSSVG